MILSVTTERPVPLEPLYHIPTYYGDTNTWGYTDYQTRDDFKTFILSCFKEPGKYEFDETSFMFNEQGRLYNKNRIYCEHEFGSKGYKKYWDTEKEKNRKGVIYVSKSGLRWFIPRDYYMWLNFLPIFNKEVNDIEFPSVRDAQYHMALYELLAELHYKHAVILKKRQIAASYFHMAKLINQFWFEKGVTLKLLASQDSYINDEGSWVFLSEYRDFLNEHTAWFRPCDPDKLKNWQQKIKVTINGREVNKGNKSRLIGKSTQQSPTAGVGGAARYAVFEEGGIAPTADKTYRYMKPALESGLITVGMFIIYGSVGDLHQCEPLKKFLLYAKENDFYAVRCDLIDNKGTIKDVGLFIPEQWSMPPYIDQYGNSLVEEALEALRAKRELQKKDLSSDDYQLEISQHPITIEEAFAWREESLWPQHLISKQIQRIDDGLYPEQHLDLYRDADGLIQSRKSKYPPISVFPLPPKTENKEGCLVVYERPDEKAEWGTYFGSIDPVSTGKTKTSDSLVSIFIYKNPIDVIRHHSDGTIKQHVEGDKLVATWCGRFDDVNNSHRRLEMIIEWYKAWTLCENNVSEFINYMILKNKQHWLVPKDQIMFLKELTANNGYSDYGWRNTGNLFKDHLIHYGINFLKEELFVEKDNDDNVIKIKYGVERIPDKMLLKEMQQHYHGLNVDRIVAYCALIAFVKVQLSNKGPIKRVEYAKNFEKNQKKPILSYQPFNHIGKANSTASNRPKPRSGFKNLR